MTQASLAERCGCSERSVRQAEAGSGSTELLVRLGSSLGMHVAGRSLPAGEHLGGRLLELQDQDR